MELRLAGVQARLRPLAWDAALTLGVALAAVIGIVTHHGARTGLWVLAAVGILPLVVRRLFPIPVLADTAAVTASVAWFYGWWPYGTIIALYTVAAHCPRRRAVSAGVVAMVAVALPVIVREVDWTPLGWNDLALLVGRLIPLAAAWLLGDNMRTRRDYLRAVEDRAAQLEREQEANARRAAAEEQARIAREVHDVVAHNLSVIIVQATAADAVFTADPVDAQRAVRTIGSTARRALDELRHVLGTVEPETLTEAAWAPQPTLDRLPDLLEHVRGAGLAVDLDVSGQKRELPPTLELSAYRIVQEALTNTLRHARAERATVSLRFDDDALGIEVVDDGAAGAAANGDGGRGLIGMHERAATVGGHVEAGPALTGGFRVAARLPYGTAER